MDKAFIRKEEFVNSLINAVNKSEPLEYPEPRNREELFMSEVIKAVYNISQTGGAVDSVNGQTGVVTLDIDDFNTDNFVKGTSIYGGTVVTNANTIIKNGFYTALGTATGVPNITYSWFITHQNSNVGTTYATQRAIAYNSSLIVYERVKNNSTWSSWEQIYPLASTSVLKQVKFVLKMSDFGFGYSFETGTLLQNVVGEGYTANISGLYNGVTDTFKISMGNIILSDEITINNLVSMNYYDTNNDLSRFNTFMYDGTINYTGSVYTLENDGLENNLDIDFTLSNFINPPTFNDQVEFTFMFNILT